MPPHNPPDSPRSDDFAGKRLSSSSQVNHVVEDSIVEVLDETNRNLEREVEKLKAELATRLNKTALKKKMARDKVKNAGLKARRAYMAKLLGPSAVDSPAQLKIRADLVSDAISNALSRRADEKKKKRKRLSTAIDSATATKKQPASEVRVGLRAVTSPSAAPHEVEPDKHSAAAIDDEDEKFGFDEADTDEETSEKVWRKQSTREPTAQEAARENRLSEIEAIGQAREKQREIQAAEAAAAAAAAEEQAAAAKREAEALAAARKERQRKIEEGRAATEREEQARDALERAKRELAENKRKEALEREKQQQAAQKKKEMEAEEKRKSEVILVEKAVAKDGRSIDEREVALQQLKANWDGLDPETKQLIFVKQEELKTERNEEGRRRREAIKKEKRQKLAAREVEQHQEAVKQAAEHSELAGWHSTAPRRGFSTRGNTSSIEQAELTAREEMVMGSPASNDDAILRAMARSNPEAHAEMTASREAFMSQDVASEEAKQRAAIKEAWSATVKRGAGSSDALSERIVLAEADYLLSMIRAGVTADHEKWSPEGARFHVNSDGETVYRMIDVERLKQYPNASAHLSPTAGTLERRQANVSDTERRRREAAERRAEAEARSLNRRRRVNADKEAADRASAEAASLSQLGSSREGAHASANKAYFLDMRAKARAKYADN